MFVRFVRPAAPVHSGARHPGQTHHPIAAAMLAALFWSLHPLRVENAAWISGLLYVGSTTLALLAVLLHLRSSDSRQHPVAYVAGALSYLGSVLIYPVYLALPAVLVWRAAVSSAEPWVTAAAKELRRTAAWWIAAVGSAGMNLLAQAVGSEPFTPVTGSRALSWLESAIVIAKATLHYAARTVWPGDVGVFYGNVDGWLAPWPQRIAATIIAIVVVALLLRRTTRRPVLGWGVAALLALAPFLTQMNSTFHPSDRYAVVWLAVWAAAIAIWLVRPCSGQQMRTRYAVGLIALAAFTAIYRAELPNWKDTTALQASIDRYTADQPSVRLGFARAAVAAWWLGNHEMARRKLEEGAARFPGHLEITQAQATLRELDQRWAQRVGSQHNIAPFAVSHVDLGRRWQARGETRAAAAHFARALHLAPAYGEALRGWQETGPHD